MFQEDKSFADLLAKICGNKYAFNDVGYIALLNKLIHSVPSTTETSIPFLFHFISCYSSSFIYNISCLSLRQNNKKKETRNVMGIILEPTSVAN